MKFPEPQSEFADQVATEPQDAYNKALSEFDVLVMPTVARPPPNFGDVQGKDSPLADNDYLPSVIHNTAPFDSKISPRSIVVLAKKDGTDIIKGTGHPALSLPCGFVPAVDNASIKLPTGIMLVGRMYDDVTVLKMAAAWEKAFDWKTM